MVFKFIASVVKNCNDKKVNTGVFQIFILYVPKKANNFFPEWHIKNIQDDVEKWEYHFRYQRLL